jgi:uncharacterized membrane protein YcfT
MVQALRVDWVDTAKGICIVFVVMMHAVLGVEAAAGETGWMHAVIAFAAPFRMPDFFLISGLFLANVINPGLEALSRPESRSFRLLLCALDDHPVRREGTGLCR